MTRLFLLNCKRGTEKQVPRLRLPPARSLGMTAPSEDGRYVSARGGSLGGEIGDWRSMLRGYNGCGLRAWAR
jgi:hypothetical protein